MIAIGSPLTKALGIAGRDGSQRRGPVTGGRVDLLGRGVPVGRGIRRCARRRAAGRAGTACSGCRPLASLVELGLCGGAFGRQLVQLGLLSTEGLLGLRQRRHRGLLAGLRVDDRLVRILLGQPRGRLLVHLFGPRPLQITDHPLGADRQRLRGRRGVEDVTRVGCGQIRARRSVDIRCDGERVEAILRRRDGDVGILHALRAGVEFDAARRRRCPVRSAHRRSPC